MRSLLLALLLLSATTAHAEPALPPLAVVFVTVDDAGWPADERAALVADAAEAIAWLQARGVAAPLGVEVLPDQALSADELTSWEWLRYSPRRLTLHAVANWDAPHLGVGPHGWGAAFVPPDRLVVLAEYDVVSRQAVIAHELMHALAGLPDWEGCDEIDIMCSPGPAYAAGTLGCRTLAALHRPCERIYLPTLEGAMSDIVEGGSARRVYIANNTLPPLPVTAAGATLIRDLEQYFASVAGGTTLFSVTTDELALANVGGPVALLRNPVGSGIDIHVAATSFGTNGAGIFRRYRNVTVTTAGTATTPINRGGGSNSPLSVFTKAPNLAVTGGTLARTSFVGAYAENRVQNMGNLVLRPGENHYWTYTPAQQQNNAATVEVMWWEQATDFS